MVFVRAHPPCPHALPIPVESSPAATAGTEPVTGPAPAGCLALGTPSHCAVALGTAQGSKAGAGQVQDSEKPGICCRESRANNIGLVEGIF